MDEQEIEQVDLCELMMMAEEGTYLAQDGCIIVEPDGKCPHGYDSWLLAMGMI